MKDIDGERRGLRVERDKGVKDRDVALSAATLGLLRHYWSLYRPRDWLFSNDNTLRPLSVSTSGSGSRTRSRAMNRRPYDLQSILTQHNVGRLNPRERQVAAHVTSCRSAWRYALGL